MRLIPALAATFLFLGCSSSDTPGANSPRPFTNACSLEGKWSRCSDNGGGGSGLVTLTVTGNQLFETIENFSGNTACQGAPDPGAMAFNAEITLAEIGASTHISGGTDAELKPDVDLFGCGANQPAYTVLKFADDCRSFQTTQTPPSCDPNNRGNAIDPAPFAKQ
ncbi:MAG TPA: hypothetical protein PKC28_14130 [Bdellovibrionales bacterium]|nr:hypothetical protein [Bdellovibrionales bacterium]